MKTDDCGEQITAARCWKPAANILQAKVGKESSQVGLSPALSLPPTHTSCPRHINIHQDLNALKLFSAEFEVSNPERRPSYGAFLDSDLFLRWLCDAVRSWRTGTTRVSGSGGY